MSVLRGCSYLLQLKDNGVWNAFRNSKALPKQKVSYCEVIYTQWNFHFICLNANRNVILLPNMTCFAPSSPLVALLVIEQSVALTNYSLNFPSAQTDILVGNASNKHSFMAHYPR